MYIYFAVILYTISRYSLNKNSMIFNIKICFYRLLCVTAVVVNVTAKRVPTQKSPSNFVSSVGGRLQRSSTKFSNTKCSLTYVRFVIIAPDWFDQRLPSPLTKLYHLKFHIISPPVSIKVVVVMHIKLPIWEIYNGCRWAVGDQPDNNSGVNYIALWHSGLSRIFSREKYFHKL